MTTTDHASPPSPSPPDDLSPAPQATPEDDDTFPVDPVPFDPEKDREDRIQARRMIRSASRFSYIGIEFVVAPTLCFFAGRWLDGYFGTSPIFKIALTIFGIATAVYDLVRLSRNAKREMERSSHASS